MANTRVIMGATLRVIMSLTLMAVAISSLIGAFYSQFRVRTMQSELEFELPTVDIKKRTEELNRRIEEHLQRIIEKAPERVEAAAIDQKLKDLENKITIAQQQTLGLRQAINPSKPEEILTIARLTDELKTLRKEAEGFNITMGAQQKLFQDSILRELASSTASTNLILIVLIPLVLNFVYTVWKDFRATGEKKGAWY